MPYVIQVAQTTHGKRRFVFLLEPRDRVEPRHEALEPLCCTVPGPPVLMHQTKYHSLTLPLFDGGFIGQSHFLFFSQNPK